MGFLVQGVCYPDLAVAKAEHCASKSAVWGSTTTVYTSECTNANVTGSTFTLTRYTNGGSASNQTHTYPTFPTCNYDSPTDLSMESFSLVLGFLVVVWAASLVWKHFRRNMDPA
jgi:hypothetical protein